MKPPRNIKKVQRLTGCIAILGHFMSRSADKCQPFFCILRRRANFAWDKDADEAFQALKTYLVHLPKIPSLLPGETLLLYPGCLRIGHISCSGSGESQRTDPGLLSKSCLSRGRGELSFHREVRLRIGDGQHEVASLLRGA